MVRHATGFEPRRIVRRRWGVRWWSARPPPRLSQRNRFWVSAGRADLAKRGRRILKCPNQTPSSPGTRSTARAWAGCGAWRLGGPSADDPNTRENPGTCAAGAPPPLAVGGGPGGDRSGARPDLSHPRVRLPVRADTPCRTPGTEWRWRWRIWTQMDEQTRIPRRPGLSRPVPIAAASSSPRSTRNGRADWCWNAAAAGGGGGGTGTAA